MINPFLILSQRLGKKSQEREHLTPNVVVCENNGVIAIARFDDFVEEVQSQRARIGFSSRRDFAGATIHVLFPELTSPVFRFSDNKPVKPVDYRNGSCHDLERILNTIQARVEARTFFIAGLNSYIEGSRLPETGQVNSGEAEGTFHDWDLEKVRKWLFFR